MNIKFLKIVYGISIFFLTTHGFGYASMGSKEDDTQWFPSGFLNRGARVSEDAKGETPRITLFKDIKAFNSTHYKPIADLRQYDASYDALVHRILNARLTGLSVDVEQLHREYSPKSLCERTLVYLESKIGPLPTHITDITKSNDHAQLVITRRPLTTSELFRRNAVLLKPFFIEERDKLRNVVAHLAPIDPDSQLIRAFFVESMLTMLEFGMV